MPRSVEHADSDLSAMMCLSSDDDECLSPMIPLVPQDTVTSKNNENDNNDNDNEGVVTPRHQETAASEPDSDQGMEEGSGATVFRGEGSVASSGASNDKSNDAGSSNSENKRASRETDDSIGAAGTRETPRPQQPTSTTSSPPPPSSSSLSDMERVRVFARFRPESSAERAASYGAPPAVDLSAGADVIMVDPTLPSDPSRSTTTTTSSSFRPSLTFSYRGGVFGPGSTQEEVFDAVARPLVQCATRGINASLIAYGQTSSGKTHTMAGSDAWIGSLRGLAKANDQGTGQVPSVVRGCGAGMVPRIAAALFDEIRARESRAGASSSSSSSSSGTSRAVGSGTRSSSNNGRDGEEDAGEDDESATTDCSVSFLEIYNEQLRDLLSPTSQVKLKLRERRGHGLWAPDATTVPVSSVADVLAVAARGEHRRAKAHTRANERSSRSHSIFILTVTTTTPEVTRVAQIYLVDLAGSERLSKSGAEGTQLTEAKGINTSLLALGNVIERLAASTRSTTTTTNRHVPYRDSLLTRVLQHSLAGSGVTHLLVCASESAHQARETIASLRFGDRAARIKGRPAEANVVLDPRKLLSSLREARAEVREVRSKLAEARAANERLAAALGWEGNGTDGNNSVGIRGLKGGDWENACARCAARDQVMETLRETIAGLREAAREAEEERLRQAREAEDNVNQGFFCPITREIFVDPVVAADGHTYEREAITSWLKTHGTSPLKGGAISKDTLINNWSMRSMIAADPVASKLSEEAANDIERAQRVRKPIAPSVAKIRGLVLLQHRQRYNDNERNIV